MAENPKQSAPPELKKKKKKLSKVRGIRTSEKPLPYDSTHCYLQMGAATQASMEARKSLRKVALVLDDVQVSRTRNTDAVLGRLQDFMAQAADLEILLLKLEKLRQDETASLVSRAFLELRAAMGWYQKMLEAHKEEDKVVLLPVLEQLKALVIKLGDVRQQKVTAALKMEEHFSKSRHQYWQERAQATLKTKKLSNKTEPVKDTYLPYPVNSEEPQVSLDPKQLIEQAVKQIKARDQLKQQAREQKLSEQEYGSEPSDD